MGTTTAVYDAHADWYEEYVASSGDYFRRVHAMLGELLGTGDGVCLDVCCGTGSHASVPAGLGWTPVGVDLSRGQLRHAVGRLPVAAADATALPLADGSVPAAMCLLASTDVPDYAAVLREIVRVLRPGGRFVHVGLHPCFVGLFADRSDAARVVLDERYSDRSYTFITWNSTGVRARVGAWHVPLAKPLKAAATASPRTLRTAEAGPEGLPDIFGFVAVKDG
jgi:SAM-dependent methyltransferase